MGVRCETWEEWDGSEIWDMGVRCETWEWDVRVRKAWEWRLWHDAWGIQCIRKVFTALHFLHILVCYSLIPKWIQIIIFLKILHTIPRNDNVKNVFGNILQIYKKIKKSHVHSLCHDTQNWAQVHPISTGHPWDVSTTWLESTCGKFSWLDMIWNRTHLSI